MNKTTFALQYGAETSIAYVEKVKDEMTKNHKTKDSEVIARFMPQVFNVNGHKLCPVRSFENFLNHLNPKYDSLWQWPLKGIPKNGSQV